MSCACTRDQVSFTAIACLRLTHVLMMMVVVVVVLLLFSFVLVRISSKDVILWLMFACKFVNRTLECMGPGVWHVTGFMGRRGG